MKPGDNARLMLGWRRTGPIDRRYVFFLHLLDTQHPNGDGSPRLLAQTDHELGYGRFPTPYWETWTNPHIVLDEHLLEIPPDTPPGTYEVWAGIYDREPGSPGGGRAGQNVGEGGGDSRRESGVMSASPEAG